MTFLIENWMLIAVALVSGGMLFWPMLRQGGGSASVTPNEAVQLINRDKAVLVDVCSADEYASAHVAGAKHVALAELDAKLAGVAKNKQAPLILVCASGMRSQRAVAVARKLGYEQAVSLAGGLKAWREANLPVAKGAA